MNFSIIKFLIVHIPDYEKFLLDFAEIMGDYPQTTTSVADKYPERIRALIKQIGIGRMEDAALRFSVRTLSQFYWIMEEYSPQNGTGRSGEGNLSAG